MTSKRLIGPSSDDLHGLVSQAVRQYRVVRAVGLTTSAEHTEEYKGDFTSLLVETYTFQWIDELLRLIYLSCNASLEGLKHPTFRLKDAISDLYSSMEYDPNSPFEADYFRSIRQIATEEFVKAALATGRLHENWFAFAKLAFEQHQKKQSAAEMH